MKTLKFIGFLFLIFNFNAGICQVDLFTDDDEDNNDEPQEVNQEAFMSKITGMLKQGEASPIGNWAGETIELMTDGRFADAPQEYLMAFQVKTKVLKVQAFNAALRKLDLLCEERKALIQSYLLFLGTLYLDMYSMDFFNEKTEYTGNEAANVFIGAVDAESKFLYGVYDREGMGDENDEVLFPCENDLSDSNITDCNCSACDDVPSGRYTEEIKKTILQMDVIHPLEVSKLLVDLQGMLNSLPCKD